MLFAAFEFTVMVLLKAPTMLVLYLTLFPHVLPVQLVCTLGHSATAGSTYIAQHQWFFLVGKSEHTIAVAAPLNGSIIVFQLFGKEWNRQQQSGFPVHSLQKRKGLEWLEG